MRKAKLIWYPQGYKVDSLNWFGYKPYCNGDMVAHDLFEHTSTDDGTWEMEVKAMGAKLRFEDMCVYQEGFALASISKRELLKKYDTPRTRNAPHFNIFPVGEKSILKASKVVCAYFGKSLSIRKCRKLMREGFKHAEQFRTDAYLRVCNTNFSKYNNQLLNLEVSLITGKILKKIPRHLDK